ncbi:hypothetical protein [Butyrivibrio proteoclasticus]|uniref:hypothetical protein n=1 Tax=Butyrivibrio proteoclasticus TaxID=43305 RepID=UPI00047C03ED|nr:hypothetical protein [Butyrivibrio proteoclasticus]
MKKRFLTKLLAIVMSVGLVLHPVAVYAEDPVEGDVPATILDVDQNEESGDESGGSGDGAGVEDPDQDPDYVPEQNPEDNPDYVPPVDNNQDPNAAPSNNPEELVGDEDDDDDESDAAAEQDSAEGEEDAEEEEEALLTLGATRGFLVNISNMRIEGDYILWDEVGGAGYYKLEVAGHSSVGLDRLINLRSKCEYWNLDYGTYDVTVTALAQSGEKVSRPCTVSYTYAPEKETLPELQNVRIEGDYLYWDLLDGADMYTVTIGGQGDNCNNSPLNLYDECSHLNMQPGTYEVKIVAINIDMEDLSEEVVAGEYTYSEKAEKTLIKTVTVQTDASSIAKEDGETSTVQIISVDRPEVIVEFNSWVKITDDGKDQLDFGNTFITGKYRIDLSVSLKPEYSDSFEIDEDLLLVIDGVACKCYIIYDWNGEIEYCFRSEPYIVGDIPTPTPPPELQNVRIEGDYLYWDLYDGANSYYITIGNDIRVTTSGSSYDLYEECAHKYADPGTYEITIVAKSGDEYITETAAAGEFIYSGNPTVHVEGDVAYWKASSDAVTFYLEIIGHYGSVNLDSRSYNLADFCYEAKLEAGIYKMRLSAYNSSGSTYGSCEFDYTYVPRKTWVKSISVRSNARSIMRTNGQTDGVQITNNDIPEIVVEFSGWVKVQDDGTEQHYNGSTFTPGKYKMNLTASFDKEKYGDLIEIDEYHIQLFVDGVACSNEGREVSYGTKYKYFFKSAEYTVNDATTILPKLQNVRIEEDYLYWDLLDGADLYNVSIGDVSDNYTKSPVNLSDACENLGIKPGTYEVRIVAINGDMDDVSEEAVAGEYAYSYKEKIEITSGSATSNIADILVARQNVAYPTFSSDDHLKVTPYYWQYLKDGNWKDYDSEIFRAGKYRLMVSVLPDSGDYEINGEIQFNVNGIGWTYFGNVVDSKAKVIGNYFLSPEFTVEKSTTLVELQNVSLQGKYIYWDEIPDEIADVFRYEISVAGRTWWTFHSPFNIREMLDEIKNVEDPDLEYGTYTVSIAAVDYDYIPVSEAYDLEYTYKENTLPNLQNVRIEGNYLYWDSLDGAEIYKVSVGTKSDNFGSSPVNLSSACEDWRMVPGSYEVKIVAITSDMNDDLSQVAVAGEYIYNYKERIEITSGSATHDIADVLKVGQDVSYPTFSSDDHLKVTPNYWLYYDGIRWYQYTDATFRAGTYKLRVTVVPDNDDYVINKEIDFYTNGERWTYEGKVSGFVSKLGGNFLLSPEFTIDNTTTTLPKLQNVRIEGDYLYWDLLDGADMYNVAIGDVTDNYITSPVNLNEMCKSLGIQPGTYEVKIVAIDGDMDDLSEKSVAGEYTYSEKAKQVLDLSTVHVEGNLLYWETSQESLGYRLDIGDDLKAIFVDGMPFDLADCCHDKGLEAGAYKMRFYALDTNHKYTEAYEFEFNYVPKKTLIKSVSVKTNASDIAKLDGKRTDAQVTNSETPEVTVGFYRWLKVKDDGTDQSYYGTTFTPGKYRIELTAYLDPDYADSFEIDKGLQLVIDGVACDYYTVIVWNGSRNVYYFKSGEYTVEDTTTPLPELQNVRIEGDYLYWDSIDGVNNYIVSIDGVRSNYGQAPVNLYNACKNYGFEPGTYEVKVVAIGGNLESLSKEAVAGQYIYGPKGVTEITSADGTHDINDILLIGQNTVFPTFTSSTHLQINSLQWQILEDDSWKTYGKSTFVPGTYRLLVSVLPESDDYKIERAIKFVANGVSWEYAGNVVDTDASVIGNYFYSPAFTAMDPSITLTELQNVRIDGDMLRWDAVEGASMYRIVAVERTEWATGTEFNVRTMFDAIKSSDPDLGYGTYIVKITAVNSDKTPLSETYEISYTYTYIPGKTEITSGTATHNIDEILKDGQTVALPTFSSDDHLKVTPFYWQYQDNYMWSQYNEATFKPGTYRIMVSVLPDSDDYAITDEIEFYANGEQWTFNGVIVGTDTKVIGNYFVSPEFTIGNTDPEPEKTVISEINATSDISDFMVDGGQLKIPSFTSDMDEYVTFSGFFWEVKDGDNWKMVGNSGPVSEGIYRYTTYVYIKSSASKTHRFSTDLALFVDNQEWTCSGMVDNNGDLPVMASFTSPEIEVKGSSTPDPEPEKQALTSVTAASDYLSLAKYGGTVQDPSFDIAEIKASESDVSGAAPITISGRWYRKEGNAWAEQLDGTFTAGTWRYEVDAIINSDAIESYEFDSSFKLTVNSEQWQEIFGFGGQSATERTFISKEIEIKEDTPEPVPTEISTVNATSNMTDLFADGKTIDSGVKYTVDGGYASITGMYWQKYVEGNWEIAQRYGNEFNPGTYRIQVIVTVNDADYYLAEDVGLVVDGVNYVFQQAGIRNGSYLMNAYFASPEMVIKDSSSTGGDDNNGGNNDNGGGNQSNPSSNQGGGQSSGGSSGGSSDGEIPADAVTITTTASAPTGTDAAGPAVLGASRNNNAASRTVKIKKGKLTDAQFKRIIIENIMKTPDGGTLRIETEWIACFDREILQAFAKKATINLEVVFPYKKSKMTVLIPAGFDINKLLDKNGYCGFLRLASIIPAKTEDKFEG